MREFPKAFFFDFDGTILDTETPEIDTWREVFEAYGAIFPEGELLAMIGKGADQILLKPADLFQRTIGFRPDELAIKRQAHEAILRQPVRPGILPLLNELRAEGIPTAIVSSSDHAWIEGHLSRLGLLEAFGPIIGREDAPRAKPAPDLYLRAADLLDFAAEDCIALEDSPNGVKAAVAAGIYAAVYPNASTRMLDLSEADELITDLVGWTLPGREE